LRHGNVGSIPITRSTSKNAKNKGDTRLLVIFFINQVSPSLKTWCFGQTLSCGAEVGLHPRQTKLNPPTKQRPPTPSRLLDCRHGHRGFYTTPEKINGAHLKCSIYFRLLNLQAYCRMRGQPARCGRHLNKCSAGRNTADINRAGPVIYDNQMIAESGKFNSLEWRDWQ